MSRDSSTTWRPLAVWLAATAATAAAATVVPGAWRAVGTGGDEVPDLVVAVCATALALALSRTWMVTTSVAAALVRARVSHVQAHVQAHDQAHGATRRLVLAACGVAVVAGAGVPAVAAPGDRPEVLAGLGLPDRAVAPPLQHPHPAAAPPGPTAAYVVRPGDSLWSIARAHPSPGASVDQRWRAIWQANRDLVGDDPDLILPGQALRLPGDTSPARPDHHDTDGAR